MKLRSEFLQDLVRKWVSAEPDKALEFASAQHSPRLRGELCEAALAAMARSDRQGALQWAHDHLEGDSFKKAMRGILGTWSESDPLQACVWLLHQSPSQIDESANVVINRLVETDLNSAMQQMAWLSNGPLRDQLVPRFVESLSDVDPNAAAAWLTRNTTADEFGRLASVLTQRWGYDDPQAALNWLASNSDRTNVSNSIAAVTSYYAETDVAGALKFAENQSDAAVQAVIYNSVATTWAAAAPDQALAWFEGIPDPTMRQQVASSLSAGLSLSANSGQVAALAAETDPAVRDTLLISYANMEAHQNTDEALNAAASIQNPQQQSDVLRQVFATVSARTPNQAAAWLASPAASDANRALLQGR